MHMNFMRNQSTPSVTYQQRPMAADTVRMGDISSSSPSSSYHPHPNPSFISSFYNYAGGGFFGASQPVHRSSQPSSSTSKQTPPPPPPPTGSAWDFLNPFESVDNFYCPYSPSRDSMEVREEEGIPDLEEDDSEQEVVKKVHVDHKFVDGGRHHGRSYSSKVASKDEDDKPSDPESLYQGARPTVSAQNDPVDYEVHIVDKKVVNDPGTSEDHKNVRGFTARGCFNGDSDVMREIQLQFERASESGSELAKILEVG
ncbi:unnamed protein product [Cuscuta campestris]|uniref:DUF632 domain-containing protein n=1 Tax=Cuscuta campestris TaxID=132261 RepID=A0A484M349_9ASTE|nr:unnamed protein product [Cuscuta campestris]